MDVVDSEDDCRSGYQKESGPPAKNAEHMQKLEDELDNRLADESLAEDSEGLPIEILFQRYGRML